MWLCDLGWLVVSRVVCVWLLMLPPFCCLCCLTWLISVWFECVTVNSVGIVVYEV